MGSIPLALGIDFGTSGVRIAIINKSRELIYTSSVDYKNNLEHCHDWIDSCEILIREIPKSLKSNLVACSIDGTSGTLIACDFEGHPIGKAVPYYINCIDDTKGLLEFSPIKESSLNRYSSIRRAIYLTNKYGSDILLRHQADWVTGWLLNNWDLGEEGNNIKLGWSLLNKQWLTDIKKFGWFNSLPKIIASGNLVGTVSPSISQKLDLPINLKVFSGTTDSNAAVLAVNPSNIEGITVLGSTLVIKRFASEPTSSDGITNHLVGGKWLTGGASNSGAAVLKKFFSDEDLIELSRQINPELDSGLKLIPLMTKGERFPINDPDLKPILEPRPTSDALYLHALLESIARIEAQGWNKFEELGLKKPQRIITIGGGARNPQWRRIRERMIGIPIISSQKKPAEGMALLAMQSINQCL